MTSPHANPEKNGHQFGVVLITIDTVKGDCRYRVNADGARNKAPHLHSLEEIQGAYQAHITQAATVPASADIARALKFAAQQINNNQKGRHYA